MKQHTKQVSPSRMVIFTVVLFNAVIVRNAFIATANTYWWLLLSLPLLVVAVYYHVNTAKPPKH